MVLLPTDRPLFRGNGFRHQPHREPDFRGLPGACKGLRILVDSTIIVDSILIDSTLTVDFILIANSILIFEFIQLLIVDFRVNLIVDSNPLEDFNLLDLIKVFVHKSQRGYVVDC
jgi:hypothetical protein